MSKTTDAEDTGTDRRGLFKAAGIVAAGVGAATLLDASPADAADGGNVVIGTSNTATSATTLTTTAAPNLVALVDDNSGFAASAAAYPGALGAWSKTRVGMYAYTQTGQAAVVAYNASGLSLRAGGTGRILQELTGSTGAPTYAATQGEQVRDSNGDLYLCTVSGTPGTWQRVAAVRPGYGGGAQHQLASPIRLLDTRAGKASRNGPTGRLAAGSTFTLPVAGFTYLSQTIPADATAVIGNVTIAAATGHGYAILYPNGQSQPVTSNINFEKGQTIANAFTLTVGTAQSIKIFIAGSATDLLFDVVGFVA